MSKRTASLSLDLDNVWTYLKTRGVSDWESAPSYLSQVVPIILEFLEARKLRITFFIVGRDAGDEENRESLRRIVDAGHELGNHSFNHEPWIDGYDRAVVLDELTRADEAIRSATGQELVGFRGPGYCYSSATIEAVRDLGYAFDASILPSVIGPLARMYYFWRSGLSRSARRTRRNLYGRATDGVLPLKPFEWRTASGGVLEIPVTTMPVFRVPFHPSYVLWLSSKSESLARAFVRLGLTMCLVRGVEPSIILHPLDFLGHDDASAVAFFPGMDVARHDKERILDFYLDEVRRHFDIVPLSEHAARIRAGGVAQRELKPFEPAARG